MPKLFKKIHIFYGICTSIIFLQKKANWPCPEIYGFTLPSNQTLVCFKIIFPNLSRYIAKETYKVTNWLVAPWDGVPEGEVEGENQFQT
jgi:hypothetical protein